MESLTGIDCESFALACKAFYYMRSFELREEFAEQNFFKYISEGKR